MPIVHRHRRHRSRSTAAKILKPRILALLAIALLILGLFGLRAAAVSIVGRRISSVAESRNLEASWQSLDVGFPARVRLTGLAAVGTGGDTAFSAETLSVALDPLRLILLRPRLRAVTLAHARIRMITAADPDTLLPDEPASDEPVSHATAERVRRTAERLTQLVLAPARELPSLTLRDVSIETSRDEDALFGGAQLSWLTLGSRRKAIHLAASGRLELGRDAPFDVDFIYAPDDRLVGRANFSIPTAGKKTEPFAISVDGHLAQDHGAEEVRLSEESQVKIGELPIGLSGSLSRDGPHLRFAVKADGITQQRVFQSLPRAILGPLLDLSVRGSFDYRVGFDLDLAKPKDVDLHADVIPHGLRLDPAGTRLHLLGLDQPFVAQVHLPHARIVTRELSSANPHFRLLDNIDSTLAHAVVTNEDGGFFRHRGFNLEAVKASIAANLKAGAYRRGAGTITMQLARNLYLGHEKTLSRKAQEVVLAWVLENLTGVGKRRLLEIYLNIIEWGPNVHGADEAAWYYFGHDAGTLSANEALFLSTVIPAPTRWRNRFGPDGKLRRYAAAQMHFIGKAMIAKGWLAPEALVPTDSMQVELRGAARALMTPAPMPDTLAAPADSARAAAATAVLR